METDTQKQKDEVKDILIACHANMAAANLKLRYWDDAIESCLKVFQFDPTHIKASYRIGQAYIAKGEFDLGIEIVEKGLEKVISIVLSTILYKLTEIGFSNQTTPTC